MQDYQSLLFFPALVSFAVTLLITPVVIIFAKKLGLIDDPKRHIHPGIIHSKPIPRGGGAALFIGILTSALLFLPLNPVTIAILFSSFLALSIGIIDDKLNAQAKDVSPYLRFLINILCAVIVVASGVTIPFITNPFGGILHFDSKRKKFDLHPIVRRYIKRGKVVAQADMGGSTIRCGQTLVDITP